MADSANTGGRHAHLIARLLETLLLIPWGGKKRLQKQALAQVLPGPESRLLFFSAFYPPSMRANALEAVWGSLSPGGSFLLLDYNTPRQWWRKLLAFGWFFPWLLLGVSPRQRLRYPAAREVQAKGFQVKSLRLLGGECFQVVVVEKPQVSGRQA